MKIFKLRESGCMLKVTVYIIEQLQENINMTCVVHICVWNTLADMVSGKINIFTGY